MLAALCGNVWTICAIDAKNGARWRYSVKGLLVTITALGLLMVAAPLFAHHGTAAYDMSQLTTLKATITDFQYINPHVLFFFDAKDDKGDVRKWQGEVSNPLALTRQGWNRHTFKPGDQLTIIGNAAKSGAKSMWITRIILANGQEVKHLHNTDQE
jgi:Family of unknown function (DUF6152)